MEYIKRILPGGDNKGPKNGIPENQVFTSVDSGRNLAFVDADLIKTVFLDSTSIQELLRIQQKIRRASSEHRDLLGGWADAGAEELVDKLLNVCDKLKNDKGILQQSVKEEKEAKFQAQAWAKTKEQLVDRGRLWSEI